MLFSQKSFSTLFIQTINLIHKHFDILSSTQVHAREFMKSHAHDPLIWDNKGYLFSCDQQTHGIGQHGRSWYAGGSANVYASYALMLPKEYRQYTHWISFAMALSVIQTLKLHSIHGQFKWVNDVLVNHKKIAGILCEHLGSFFNNQSIGIIIGVGLNVQLDASLTQHIDQPATSIFLETSKKYEASCVLKTLNPYFMHELRGLIFYDPALFVLRINKCMAFVEENVWVQTPQEIFKGILKGIAPNGQLIVFAEGQNKFFTDARIRIDKT